MLSKGDCPSLANNNNEWLTYVKGTLVFEFNKYTSINKVPYIGC